MAKGASRCDKDKAGDKILETFKTNVFVNKQPIAVIGDKVKPHGIGPHSSAKMIEGSKITFAGKLGIVREDDRASCGHKASGSEDVFIG